MMDDGSGRDPYLAPPSGRSGWVLPPEQVLRPAPGYAYVGFWRRVCAFFIDALILSIPSWLVLLPTFLGPLASGSYRLFNGPVRYITDPGTGRLIPSPAAVAEIGALLEGSLRWILLAGLLVFVLQMLYHAVFWAWRGGTPGQLLLGIQVRSELNGERISLARGCLRYVGYLISLWVFYLGFIWVAFDDRKQGWHDKIAGTVVIRRIG